MKSFLTFLVMTALTFSAHAQSNVIPLWPEGVPGAKPNLGAEQHEDGRIGNVSEPTLTVYGPAVDRANGTAVIVCPGGGYVRLSTQREGVQYANWLSTLGATTFVLKYRMKEFGHPAPLQDVLRAIRIVRSRAAEFKINPDRIGVMGSSAGGHLTATAGTLYDHAAGKTGHSLDAVSARPDFLMLMYPVITLTGDATHKGSRESLLGLNPTPELVQLLSPQLHVTKDTPPTLLIHTQEDKAVPVENSLLFFQALTRAGVPAELYAFQRGGHGMAMREGLGTSSDWPTRAAEWLKNRGLLEPSKK